MQSDEERRRNKAYTGRTVAFGVGAVAAGLLVGPGVAAVGFFATLFARAQMMSPKAAFDPQLDSWLRSKAAAGWCVTLVQKFSESIERFSLCCACSDAGSAPLPAFPGHQAMDGGSRPPPFAARADAVPATSSQPLPAMAHSGVVLRLRDAGGSLTWLRIEFSKEGLSHRPASGPAGGSSLVDSRPLQGVSPLVVADSLQRNRARTYNAFTWNCHDVAAMLWEAVLAGDSQSAAGQPAAGTAQGQHLAAEVRGGADTCVICLERPRRIAFRPCGHFNFCEECSGKVQACPLCQRSISGRDRTFD